MGKNKYLVVKSYDGFQRVENVENDNITSIKSVAIRPHGDINSLSPYQVFSGLTKEGLPFHVVVEVQCQNMDQYADVFEYVKNNILQEVAPYAKALRAQYANRVEVSTKYSDEMGKKIKKQYGDESGVQCHVSMVVAHGVKGEKPYSRYCSGFASGNAIMFVKSRKKDDTPERDNIIKFDVKKIHGVNKGEPIFSEALHETPQAGTFLREMVAYVGVPEDTTKSDDENNFLADIGNLRNHDIVKKAIAPWVAVSAVVPYTHEQLAANMAAVNPTAGSSYSLGSNSSGSAKSISDGAEGNIVTRNKAFCALLALAVVSSVAFGVADYCEQNMFTEMLDGWFNEKWPDGSGKNVATGVGFGVATTGVVGVMAGMYYYGKNAIDRSKKLGDEKTGGLGACFDFLSRMPFV